MPAARRAKKRSSSRKAAQAKPASASRRKRSADTVSPSTSGYDHIYAVVRRIPKGRVATYGQVAELAGVPRHARQVGYALNALREGDDIPWHRVVNAAGAISLRAFPGYEEIQRTLLEEEGVETGARERIDLERWRWRPRVSPGRR